MLYSVAFDGTDEGGLTTWGDSSHTDGDWLVCLPGGAILPKARTIDDKVDCWGVLGYDPEELVGRNVFELVHPDDHRPVIQEMMRARENPGERQRIEYRFKHKDGSWRTLESVGGTQPGPSTHDREVVTSRDIIDQSGSTASAFLIGYLRALQDLRDTPEASSFVPFDGGFGDRTDAGGLGELTTYLDLAGSDLDSFGLATSTGPLAYAQAWWGLPANPTHATTTEEGE